MPDPAPDEHSSAEAIRPATHSLKPLAWGAAIAVALLAIDGSLTFYNTLRLQEDNLKVAHTHRVTTGLERTLSLVKDAESGQRGYLVTGEESFLGPYQDAISQLPRQVDEIQSLTTDNKSQLARFPRLRSLIGERLDLLEQNIASRRNNNFDTPAATNREEAGKQVMDSLRKLLDEMLESENALLEKRQNRTRATYNAVVGTGVLSSLAAVSAILALLFAARRHFAARSASEQALADQGERLRTTLGSIGDAVITTDKDGLVTHLNPVAREMTKWANGDAYGKPLAEVFNIVNETSRQPVESPASRALREGSIVGLANHTVLIARDGTECAIDDSAAPIRSADGDIVGCVLVFRDITLRRESERELEISEARKSAVLASSLDAIVGMDHRGCIGDWNTAAERVFGLSREKVIGRHVADTILPEEFREGLNRFLVTGQGPLKSRRLEVIGLRGDGTRFPCELAISTTRVENTPPYYTAFVRDITDRKRDEQVLTERAGELVQADRSKDEFLAMLAHELRNPLAPMRTASEILRFPQAGRLERAYAQDILERQIGNMTRMIDDLLDVSRITQGKIDLRLQDIDLIEVLATAAEMIRPGLTAQDQTLTVDLPEQPVMLSADATRLEQIFNNLLGNACKYSGKGSHIALSATVDRDGEFPRVIVKVTDNGAGIDPELLPHVFDIFVQSSRALDRSHGGLGIGLTLVERLVKLHGGSVGARSEGPDKGAEFIVSLPILPVSAGSSTAKANPHASPGRLRLLIVDDNRDSAESLSILQQMSGHETRTANNGPDALAIAMEFQPQVVLLDIGLPGMDGYQVAGHLRDIPGQEKTFIVAMTGYGTAEDRERSKQAGFDEHLVKPVDPKVLASLLDRLA